MCSAWTSRSPDGVEQRGRAVGPLLDVGAERAALQHGTHLLGDAGEPGDQHLQGGGVEGGTRSSMRPPAAPSAPAGARASARHPSASQIVQSGSAMHRAARRRGRTPAGGSGTGRSSTAERGRSFGHGPDRDHLDGRVGTGEAVAALVLVVEGVDVDAP